MKIRVRRNPNGFGWQWQVVETRTYKARGAVFEDPSEKTFDITTVLSRRVMPHDDWRWALTQRRAYRKARKFVEATRRRRERREAVQEVEVP